MAALRKGEQAWIPDNIVDDNHVNAKGMWCKSWIRNFILENVDWHPTDSTALLDPNPLLVYYMIYIAKWNNRYVHPDEATRGPLMFKIVEGVHNQASGAQWEHLQDSCPAS